MEPPEFIYRKDGQGQYVWDPFLWILAGGVVVVIAAAVFLMDHFTPPAQGTAASDPVEQPAPKQ